MFKTLTARIKKILWILGVHAFSLILFLIFIDLIMGGLIFYKYVFLAEGKEPKVTENILKFDYKTYQDVLAQMQTKEEINEGSPTANQSNPSE